MKKYQSNTALCFLTRIHFLQNSSMMKNIIQSSVTDLPTSLSDEVVGEEYNGNPKFRNGFSHGDFINGISYKYRLKKQHYEMKTFSMTLIKLYWQHIIRLKMR